MFKTVLIANRGEIARRLIRTLKKMGIRSVAVYSDADRHAAHVRDADEAVHIGASPVSQSYLNIDAIVKACKQTGAEAVHPGYGFLSENVSFAEALNKNGITFIGPRPEHLTRFGLKHEARAAACEAGVPLLPGTELLKDLKDAQEEAETIGFPVMLKSTAGGGGIGLKLCHNQNDLLAAFETVQKLGASNFGDDGVFIEKFVETARHVEVQIFGDGQGKVIALGERDCSLQRRNQKIVEEAPAPGLSSQTRGQLRQAAISLGELVAYASAGTVEFIYDVATDDFYFLEVNTRLQVEHGVTEEIFGVDLVDMMVRQAAGDLPDLETLPQAQSGWSMEVRINAEDPARAFRPAAGILTDVTFPENVRLDSWVEKGTEVTAFYDNLLAKLIVKADTREEAIQAMVTAIDHARLYGLETNLDYLRAILLTEWFKAGDVSTRKLGDFNFIPSSVEVLSGGAQTTVQDWPGRIGYWGVGVPPSGPMDALSFRLVNKLVGNEDGAAALEATMTGPELKFHTDAIIALGGADMAATLDGAPAPMWTPIAVSRDQLLVLGSIAGTGQRTYIAFRGGLDVPEFLGSGSCFTLGQFGGHTTNAVRAGDMLRVKPSDLSSAPREPLAEEIRTPLTRNWEIGVLYGPHGAPDFFTQEDIKTLFSEAYEVHFNSARTGVRLIGPKPEWARTDGGEAGLHPSNIHDNAYAVGAIDFTGDMPIILGPDGPSLGGFVCAATIALSELWKVGQLKPGDKVRFTPISETQATEDHAKQNDIVSSLKPLHSAPTLIRQDPDASDAVLRRTVNLDTEWVYRRSGDDHILIEFGSAVLDLNLRFQANMLMEWITREKLPGIVDLTPGIRSLQIHFDTAAMSLRQLMDCLETAEKDLNEQKNIQVASRIVHLPLSWDDESTREAIEKYQTGVRPDAPWCPSNIEFIRRINALEDEQAVKDIVFGADYMVMGLGDVYLGAPVATPVDPRHRLVTTKYNPARTWTPQNAVGIGGAYMCIYGMEGPGGYQFVGRTVQIWNSWRQTEMFQDGKPWLLRYFDRIKFYPVDAQELAEARDAFPHGAYPIKTEDGIFDLDGYNSFLDENRSTIADFQSKRQAAFNAERQRWEDEGLATYVAEESDVIDQSSASSLPPGGFSADAALPGTIWKVLVNIGESVKAGQNVAILESMKMEFPVTAPANGTVHDILTPPGKAVQNGQAIITFTRDENS